MLASKKKRQRKKIVENSIKKLIVLNILFSLFLSCQNSVNPAYTDANSISGSFSNWKSTYSDSLYWKISFNYYNDYRLASTKISSNGQFYLQLPTPPNNILNRYSKFAYEDSLLFKMTDSILFSDFKAKYIRLSLTHYDLIPMPVSCGNTKYFNSSSQIGDYQIHYYYFDRPTVVNGMWNILLKEAHNPSGNEQNITTRYRDVRFKYGWNQIMIKLVSVDSDKKLFEVTNNSIVSTEWILNALPNEFVRLL